MGDVFAKDGYFANEDELMIAPRSHYRQPSANRIINMDYLKKFRVRPENKVKLNKIDASFSDKHESHEHALAEIDHYVKEFSCWWQVSAHYRWYS